MMEYNVITLEDNKEYIEIDKLTYNNNTYILLSKVDSEDSYCIRKIGIKDNKQYIIGLDDEKEFDTVLLEFAKKLND